METSSKMSYCHLSGVMVSMLAIGPKVRGFKPGQADLVVDSSTGRIAREHSGGCPLMATVQRRSLTPSAL
jgi:hypothetical protein